ncbi:MAG: efflux RND transporter periplasmic adaptor subunit [Legionellaceae bacterium]|nr:efflux RND transporter periplasmic adaptor subunit [Legionellaceae bacterium]
MTKKPMTLMIIGLSLVFGGLLAFNISKNLVIKYFFAHFEAPAVTVASVTVGEQTWKPSLHAVGDFVAVHGVDINSEASGNVAAIHFKSGETVDANTLLIDIEDGVDQARLNFNLADLALQDINYKRQQTLIKRGATSKADVDVAKAKFLEAKAKVEQTKATISQKHIQTPFAGKLGIRLVNLGEFITPGQTSIVTLQSMDPLFLQFHVPEHQRPNIHIGQNIQFSIEPKTHLVFSGKITAINAKTDPKTHNIKVQATLPNCPMSVLDNWDKRKTQSPLVQYQKIPHSDRVLITCDTEKNTTQKLEHYAFIPGMFASIDIEQPVIPNALVLPTTAISYSLYGNSVFLIQENAQKNKKQNLVVKRMFVTTGDEQDNQVVITKGLKAGQQVVSAGEIKLQDYTPVVINNEVQLNIGQP